jgi:hypothetical protein
MLHVNYQNIPFWRDKFLIDTPNGKKEDPWVFGIGILSMHTGINKITTKNAPEFYVRCKLVETCFGGSLMRDSEGEPVPISYEIIERFIGVTTNASPYTEAQFYKHLRTNVVRSLRDQYEAERNQFASERIEKVVQSLGKND